MYWDTIQCVAALVGAIRCGDWCSSSLQAALQCVSSFNTVTSQSSPVTVSGLLGAEGDILVSVKLS